MKPLREILLWPKRRWRSAGFGIHSPFAYRFITEVLYPKHGRDAPLTARLSVFFADADAKGDKVTAEEKAIEKMGFKRLPEDALTAGARIRACGGFENIENIESLESFEAPEKDCIVFDLTRPEGRCGWDLLRRRTDALGYGMDFNDTVTGVVTLFPHLPRQSFKILIKR